MIKPIRRKLRNHFGLTARQVAVRSRRPWYFQIALAISYMLFGFALAYAILHDDEAHLLAARFQQVSAENLKLQAKLITAEQALQVELATNNHLAQTLSAQQDENMKLKEELVFYRNMTKH